MKKIFKYAVVTIALSNGLLLCNGVATAQPHQYPQKPVTMVVPFPPGASLDNIVRAVANELSEEWGQSVIVENRTGAGGIVGIGSVAQAKADGYTVVAVANSFVGNTVLRDDLPYDAFEDFAPITLLGIVPHVLVTNSSVPVSTVAELIDYAQQQGGALSYSSGGIGTMSHLGAEMLKQDTGIDMAHIPYRGQGPALIDTVSGQVDLTLANLPEIPGHIKDGKIVPLAILGPNHSDILPEVPTIGELGYPGVFSNSWYGLVAPAGTPDYIINKIQKSVAAALESDDVSHLLSSQGYELGGMAPEKFYEFLSEEQKRYAEVIESAHITLEQ